MKIVAWNTPISAPWPRALDLKELKFEAAALLLNVEEEAGASWQIAFKSVQAFKTTTEECAGSLIGQLPEKGGLFEVLDSPWIKELGAASFLAKSHHYIVCCYDEVIEVIAWEAEASPLPPS
jgi:hypothetical protein